MTNLGDNGLGKTSYINQLLGAKAFDQKDHSQHQEADGKVVIRSRRQELQEDGVQMQLNLFDTPQLGDAFLKGQCSEALLAFIVDRIDDYAVAELSKGQRFDCSDGRIHLCLYFVKPSVKRLSSLDIEILRSLSRHTKVVLVIAKGESMLPDEIEYLMAQIAEQLEEEGIHELKLHGQYSHAIFSTGIDASCRKREYPWGIVNADRLPPNVLNKLVFRDLYFGLITEVIGTIYEKHRQHLSRAEFPTPKASLMENQPC